MSTPRGVEYLHVVMTGSMTLSPFEGPTCPSSVA